MCSRSEFLKGTICIHFGVSGLTVCLGWNSANVKRTTNILQTNIRHDWLPCFAMCEDQWHIPVLNRSYCRHGSRCKNPS
ncbi:hypothetical protein HBI80_212320 [Parastagonospora nodorum]|nr:hypothetical protein HBI03_198650 [Parastagonospora nodorum]KAH4277825.1 hypothetical protein HBI04_099420 [Parastagonospora nodorum]KAH4895842.1 hypothetical protein HBI80_212320 [Parastagonospora nodorum]KAH5004407.1 hypothetical protein HBI75_232690 [Parastagonospora nodorum]KAH5676415.1 hypothetical protein HBI21_111060 [Parastagonospora nodorum]